MRDGHDAGQWRDHRPSLDERALRADLAGGTVPAPDSRFKYSNHGFGLLGLAIEAVTGERYGDWVQRDVLQPLGLAETQADMPLARGVPFAHGHFRRCHWIGAVIPGDNPTRAGQRHRAS